MAHEIDDSLFTNHLEQGAATPDFPVAFTVPLTSGKLHISEEAYAAYGLAPKMAYGLASESDAPEQDAAPATFSAEIFLLSPRELAASLPLGTEVDDLGVAGFSAVTQAQEQGLVAGISIDTISPVLRQGTHIRALGRGADLALNQDGSLQELPDHLMPVELASALALAISHIVSQSEFEQAQQAIERGDRRHIRRLAAMCIACVGAVVGIDVAVDASVVGPAISAGLLSTFYSARVWNLARSFKRTAPARERLARVKSIQTAVAVRNSVYTSFCGNDGIGRPNSVETVSG